MPTNRWSDVVFISMMLTNNGFLLTVVYQISYLDAILGNENVNVEVVDGSVEIKVPSGCQPETVLRIRGKGAPQLNNASVRLQSWVPKKLGRPPYQQNKKYTSISPGSRPSLLRLTERVAALAIDSRAVLLIASGIRSSSVPTKLNFYKQGLTNVSSPGR